MMAGTSVRRLAGPALAALLAAVMPGGTALAEDEELCGMIAGAICDGGNLGPCFQRGDRWDYVPPICTGFVQTLIEMEREAMQQAPSGGGWGSGPASHGPATGMSFGGVLRNGPDMNHARVASLQNGDWLELLESTGVWMDGYQWYRVNSPAGQGFHWGGILCSEHEMLDGVLQVC